MKSYTNRLLLSVALTLSCNAFADSVIVHHSKPLNLNGDFDVSNINETTSKININNDKTPQLITLLSQMPVEFYVEKEFTSPVDHNEKISEQSSISAQQVPTLGWNDPFLLNQTELSGINKISEALGSQKRPGKKVNIAILDTGIVPHEDLSNVMGGYSLTTMFGQVANDDYTSKTTSYGKTCYSAHGVNMAGIIGASRNNSKGIVGIADANLYIGRVMSTDCNDNSDVGYLSDIAQGIYWAIGQNNKNLIPKADVINISVAANSVCPKVLQDAISAANAVGTAVVVSAGNQSSLVTNYAPANCQGVVVVAAHDASGSFNQYSNYGDKVDLTSDGNRLTTALSGYSRVDGTSGAAAAVTGSLAALKSYFPSASTAELVSIIKTTVSPYAIACTVGCGKGVLNLSLAFSRSEKVIDPVFSADHLYSTQTCNDEREIESLSNQINACDAFMVASKTSFVSNETPVNYQFKIYSRVDANSEWKPFDGTLSPTLDSQRFMLPQFNSSLTYGVAACDGDICPFIKQLDLSSVKRPVTCK